MTQSIKNFIYYVYISNTVCPSPLLQIVKQYFPNYVFNLWNAYTTMNSVLFLIHMTINKAHLTRKLSMISNLHTKKWAQNCGSECSSLGRKRSRERNQINERMTNPSIYTLESKTHSLRSRRDLLHLLHILFCFPNYILKACREVLIELHMKNITDFWAKILHIFVIFTQ